MISPTLAFTTMASPTILPLAMGLSTITMGGASLYAYKRPHNALSKWRGPLFGSLCGFVGIGLVSLGSTLIFGPNPFSTLWMNVDTYGGIVLFSGFTAYDTHMAVKKYEAGNPDHIGCATDFLLDFINLLERFMNILCKYKE